MLRSLLLTLGAALFVAACGSDAMMTPPDTSLHSYTADDPNIQTASYMGRIDFTNPQQPKFSLAATTITASFMGTGVSALIKDEYRYGMFKNYYDAQIDGMPAAKITPSGDPAMFEYTVASDLPYGEHTLVLAKRTEPNVGNGFFAGINVSGTILPAPARPTRKIEFIGDSITSGAGVEASGQNDPACMLDNGYALALMASRASGSPATTPAIRETISGRCLRFTTCSCRSSWTRAPPTPGTRASGYPTRS
jgi:hypothetical protein